MAVILTNRIIPAFLFFGTNRFVFFLFLSDPLPAHLEPFHQVTAKARVDLYPFTRWSFLTYVFTKPQSLQQRKRTVKPSRTEKRFERATDPHCKIVLTVESNGHSARGTNSAATKEHLLAVWDFLLAFDCNKNKLVSELSSKTNVFHSLQCISHSSLETG